MEDNVPNDPIPIDDFLERQSKPVRLLVTIEAVSDDDERVKVTPYVAEVGCLCSRALTVRKDVIESVTITDDVHVCCGKRLTVVEVAFADATLMDVFQQIATAVLQTMPPSPRRSHTAPLPPRPPGWSPSFPLANPFANWNRLPSLSRAVPFTWSRFGMPIAASNEATLSTEEAATGVTEQQVFHHLMHDFECSSARIACEENCFAFHSDDPEQLNICRCQCENDYIRCKFPGARLTPCV
jgi:hypothetical protein